MATTTAPTVAPVEAHDVFPINGTDYIEFWVGNAKQASLYYRQAFGFQLVGYRGPETGTRDRASYLLQQDKIRLVFRQFPLEMHKEAPKAAEAALCANEQGKFWEYHDTLFQNQQALSVENLKTYAGNLKLDTKKFNECLASGKMAATVKADMEAGAKVGVSGTPAFFINGVMLSGAQPFEEFKKVIDEELQGKQAQK